MPSYLTLIIYILLGVIYLIWLTLFIRSTRTFQGWRARRIRTAVLKTVPLGATVTWVERLERNCRRCKEGKIIIRYRHQIVEEKKNKLGLKEMSSIFNCSNCNYRGVALRDEKRCRKKPKPIPK